jgi:hypothetical protein
MTPDEITARFQAMNVRERGILDKIAVEARAVVPVLLDSGRANSAKPLQELLFELEAVAQERDQIIRDDPESTMTALLAQLRPRP